MDNTDFGLSGNILQFPTSQVFRTTLLSSEIQKRANSIESNYEDTFDYSVYDSLATKFENEHMPWGVVYKTVFRLANYHPTCTRCHYAFEIDTYGRGCVFNCGYCYAKDQLTKHGAWNKPHPFPLDIGEVRRAFASAFESDKKSKWNSILRQRIPLRIGSMSDSFMWMDKKYRVTHELLKILKHYRYPYIIFTRSDLIVQDDYLNVLDQSLAAIQFSICGPNEELTRKLEPGAPNVWKRLNALSILNKAGYRTAVRLNPLFPTFPDGYFTNKNRIKQRFDKEVPKFPLFDIDSAGDFLGSLSDVGVKTLVAGYVRLSPFAIHQIKNSTGIDLGSFFDSSLEKNSGEQKHYSDAEIAFYYTKLRDICSRNGLRFTTCYIGNGIKDYYQYQKLWSNERDCCDVRNEVKSFNASSQDIPWEVRHISAKHKRLVEEGRLVDGEVHKYSS